MSPIWQIAAVMAVLIVAAPAQSEPMPDPEALAPRMAAPPVTVTVYEPHLTVGDSFVARDYVGFPAADVFAEILGEDWQKGGEAVELRALDGYVSRIPVSKFAPGKAFLTYALADGGPFTVDNLGQNERDVPLGPYYLVWDNISDAGLRAEGALDWPYQVSEILLFSGSDAALMPDGLDPSHRAAVELARTHCLSCHMINGYGGEKYPGNLAVIAREILEPDFVGWVLAPSERRAGTTMPPLQPLLDETERQRVARAIWAYLSAVPVIE